MAGARLPELSLKSVPTNSRPSKAKTYVIGSVVLSLAGCAAVPLNSQPVAPQFHGIWRSTNTSIYNWLEIDAYNVVTFGLTEWDGRCIPTAVEIAAPDRVILHVDSVGLGQMSIALNGTVLLITGKHATEGYVQTSRADICRGSGGTYLPGAPYPQ
jgi:hypothetical protein